VAGSGKPDIYKPGVLSSIAGCFASLQCGTSDDICLTNVITGQVEVSVGTLIQTLPHIRSGKLKALGVGSQKRSPVLPNVPTISEAGVPGYDGSVWWGILAPAGVPEPIILKLNSTIAEILREPEMVKRLANEAAEPIIDTPAAFGKRIASDIQKWTRIAKQADTRGIAKPIHGFTRNPAVPEETLDAFIELSQALRWGRCLNHPRSVRRELLDHLAPRSPAARRRGSAMACLIDMGGRPDARVIGGPAYQRQRRRSQRLLRPRARVRRHARRSGASRRFGGDTGRARRGCAAR
jgi:hypothetical protein